MVLATDGIGDSMIFAISTRSTLHGEAENLGLDGSSEDIDLAKEVKTSIAPAEKNSCDNVRPDQR